MLNQNLHRLLKRQLKKSNSNMLDDPKYVDFLNKVDDAYKGFDKDIGHIENILEESLRELFVSNQKLKNERDKTKNHLENIVRNLEGVIFETDLEGKFTFLNQAWEEYSGYSIKDSIGKNFRDFLKEEYLEGSKKLDDIFDENNKDLSFVFKYNKPNNNHMFFEVKFRHVKNAKGESKGYIGTIVDITYLKETEIELQRANEAKDAFLSTMSHEIRTPLNAVNGLANILLMDNHLQEQVENLKALKYSGEHLMGLINDLLDFSKIRSGKQKLLEKDFSLNYIIENVTQPVKYRAESKGLKFEVIKSPNIPDVLIGDSIKLMQILKNLVSNSLKFTNNGYIKLIVNNKGIQNNKANIEFKVIDSGIGIPKEKHESIFESFIQANSETSIKYGGTGLGLAISKKLINLYESDLIVESELNKGSSFSFTICFKISNRLSSFNPNLIKKVPDYLPLELNILVAEDNKMNVMILRKFFKNWSVNYEVASNGQELLDIYEEKDFDLILMDLQMPILNGYKATKVIRELENKDKANIPIIALTAFAQTDIKEKTKRYKMNGFMSKPFNPPELYNLLSSYCKVIKRQKAV